MIQVRAINAGIDTQSRIKVAEPMRIHTAPRVRDLTTFPTISYLFPLYLTIQPCARALTISLVSPIAHSLHYLHSLHSLHYLASTYLSRLPQRALGGGPGRPTYRPDRTIPYLYSKVCL